MSKGSEKSVRIYSWNHRTNSKSAEIISLEQNAEKVPRLLVASSDIIVQSLFGFNSNRSYSFVFPNVENYYLDIIMASCSR